MKVNIDKISTEDRNKNTKDIDRVSTIEMLTMINNEDAFVHKAVKSQIDVIAKVVDHGYKVIRNNGRIIYIGAGTSGRLGVLDASEMPPTYNTSNDLIIGIIAGGDIALRNPIEGAEDSLEQAIEDLKKINFSKNDFLIGITASGRTPYVISGMEFAKKIGAKVASLSTTKNSQIGKIADFKIEPITGAEVITGSTRMKSGTAQKLVLNMISTGIMVKLGKVYENLMIDVKPSNEKLIERSIKIVSELAKEFSREQIVFALKESSFSPKIAIVMLNKNLSANNAIDLLKKNDNDLRKLL